jgi:hypothetical protein
MPVTPPSVFDPLSHDGVYVSRSSLFELVQLSYAKLPRWAAIRAPRIIDRAQLRLDDYVGGN